MRAVLFGCAMLATALTHAAEHDAVMSDAYWKIWNPEVQARGLGQYGSCVLQ